MFLLVGCVVLVGVLTVAGMQDLTGRVVGFLGVVPGAATLVLSLLTWWRREAATTVPTAAQLGEARGSV